MEADLDPPGGEAQNKFLPPCIKLRADQNSSKSSIEKVALPE